MEKCAGNLHAYSTYCIHSISLHNVIYVMSHNVYDSVSTGFLGHLIRSLLSECVWERQSEKACWTGVGIATSGFNLIYPPFVGEVGEGTCCLQITLFSSAGLRNTCHTIIIIVSYVSIASSEVIVSLSFHLLPTFKCIFFFTGVSSTCWHRMILSAEDGCYPQVGQGRVRRSPSDAIDTVSAKKCHPR